MTKKKIFALGSDNRIRFKGRRILAMENTIFHLFSTEGPCIDRVREISFQYFNQLVKKVESKEKGLLLLKALLQSMGWGIVTIKIEGKNRIKIVIDSPPYGLQKYGDNWQFLINTIHGYVQVIDRGFQESGSEFSGNKLVLTFNKSSR